MKVDSASQFYMWELVILFSSFDFTTKEEIVGLSPQTKILQSQESNKRE